MIDHRYQRRIDTRQSIQTELQEAEKPDEILLPDEKFEKELKELNRRDDEAIIRRLLTEYLSDGFTGQEPKLQEFKEFCDSHERTVDEEGLLEAKKIIEKYKLIIREIDQQEFELFLHLFYANEHLDEDPPSDLMRDPECLGELLYEYATNGERPTEPVTYRRIGGTIQVSISDPEDYKRLEQSSQKRWNSTKYVRSAGLYYEQISFDSDLPNLDNFIFILDETTYYADYAETVKQHEEFHFFYHKIYDDIAQEGAIKFNGKHHKTNKEYRYSSSYSRIKDELLAYTVDGRNFKQILETLTTSDCYKELFVGLTAKEKQELIDLIKEICNLLVLCSNAFYFKKDKFYSPADPVGFNNVIAYHLLDIPLNKIPEYLEAYLKYIKHLNSFD